MAGSDSSCADLRAAPLRTPSSPSSELSEPLLFSSPAPEIHRVVTILCYHAVDPDWRSSLSVTPEEFEAQCEWLARHRRVVGAAEAAVRLAISGRLGSGLVAITFDDGF